MKRTAALGKSAVSVDSPSMAAVTDFLFRLVLCELKKKPREVSMVLSGKSERDGVYPILGSPINQSTQQSD
jgi:hypothetical protein